MNTDTSYTTSATITLVGGTVLNISPADVCVQTNTFSDGAGASTFPVGAALCRTMRIELDNADDRYANTHFYGAVIWLSLNYHGESINLGRYTVRTPETYGETVIITAQDDMYKADKPFTSSLTYPATAQAVWNEMCTACGITSAGSIPQGSYSIAEKPSGELTFRAVFGYIAMLSGGNARVNRDGAIAVVNYDFATLSSLDVSSPGSTVHTLSMWRALRVDTSDIIVTGIRTSHIDDAGETTIISVGTDDYVLTLENPLWYGNETAAMQTVLSAIGGVAFRGFSGEYIAYPVAEFGDLAVIRDRKGGLYATFITDVFFAWGAATTLGNSAEPPLGASSTYTAPEAKSIQAAERMVASEKQQRQAAETALQRALDALADALAESGGLYETTETPAGGGTVYYFHDKPQKADSDLIIQLNAAGLGISTDGGQTYATGWNFATGEVIASVLSANGINADWINAGALVVRDDNNNILFQADKTNKAVKVAGFDVSDDNLSSGKVEIGNNHITVYETDNTNPERCLMMYSGASLYYDSSWSNHSLIGYIGTVRTLPTLAKDGYLHINCAFDSLGIMLGYYGGSSVPILRLRSDESRFYGPVYIQANDYGDPGDLTVGGLTKVNNFTVTGDTANVHLLGARIEIPDGADLNSDTYKYVGCYAKRRGAYVVANEPRPGYAFILDVECATGNGVDGPGAWRYLRQTIRIMDSGIVLTRSLDSDGSSTFTYGPWTMISYMLGARQAIPNGADLNSDTYKYVGCYAMQSGSYAVTNAPRTYGAFILDVECATGNGADGPGTWRYLRQKLMYMNDTTTYIRNIDSDGNGSWNYGSWVAK